MLLPSAFSYDIYSSCQSQKSHRPKLPSFGPYDSPSTSSRSGPAGLLASCRALQSMLGGSMQPAQTSLPQSTSTPPARPQNPFTPGKKLQPPPCLAAAPRGANKRRRDDFEQDSSSKNEGSGTNRQEPDTYQTPKRRRRVPLDLPLGLNASDFDALETPNLSRSRQPVLDHGRLFESFEDTPLSLGISSNRSECLAWSPDDDHRLIEAVLGKLNLSNRDWNDCARQLGKDKDSLGRRWRMLIGEGNIGLRRGVGRMERTNLDVKSW